MKRTPTHPFILLLLISVVLFSCSTNQFSIRKNFQPRIKIEGTVDRSETTPAKITSTPTDHSVQAEEHAIKEVKVEPDVKPKQTILEKIVRKTFPKKKEILDRVFDKQKRGLRKTKDTNLDGTQVPGLIIGILSLTFAIASICMIIVMVNGALTAGFVTGLILALIAMVLGIIGKFFPFRGMSTTAAVLAGLAIFLLCIFLALILAGLI